MLSGVLGMGAHAKGVGATRTGLRETRPGNPSTRSARIAGLRQPALQLDHLPGTEHAVGQLVSGPELRLALAHLVKALLAFEGDTHGREHDVAAKRHVPALDPRDHPAGAAPNGLGGRALRDLLDRQPEG